MSTRAMLGAVAVASSLAAAVACSGRHQAGNAPPVSLTGCLQPGDAPNTFRLVTVGSPNEATGTIGDAQTSPKENPTGTASKSQSSDIGAATTSVYTLIPTDKVNLSIDQGTLVRVGGRLQLNSAGSNGSPNPSAVGRPAGTSGSSDQGASANNDQRQARGGEAVSGSSERSDNKATGTGSQSFAQGQTVNRRSDTIRVDSVKRISGSCGNTR